MTIEMPGRSALEYFPCRYGTSGLLYRGPRKPLSRPYFAMLGGSETYGKYIPEPFPELVEQATGIAVINLGQMNAGLDVFLGDPAMSDLCSNARATVVQVTGAQNLSNRYYKVHPRRNDRFLRPTALLRAIYSEVDFTEFHFTRHLLRTLNATCANRFESIALDLQRLWVGRMQILLDRITAPVILLWVRRTASPTENSPLNEALLVERDMIDALRGRLAAVVEIHLDDKIGRHDGEGMVFSPLEVAPALSMPGIAAHQKIARGLCPVLASLKTQKRPA